MQRKALLMLSAAAALVALVAFQAGRASAQRQNSNAASVTAKQLRQAASVTAPLPAPAGADLAQVTIENIAEVEFSQAYELLQRASPEVLAAWTGRLETLPTGPKKTAAVRAFFRTLVQADAERAIALALQLQGREMRHQALSAIDGAAPPTAFPARAQLAIALGAREDGLAEFLTDWSRFDPGRAGEFVAAHLDRVNSRGVSLLLSNWAATDARAAGEWLERLDAARRDKDVFTGFYSGWAESERAAALLHLGANSHDPARQEAIETLAVALFLESPHAATALMLALPEGDAQSLAAQSLASYAANRPVVLGGPQPPEIAPESAARWIMSFPEGVWLPHIGELLTSWGRDNSAAALGWLNSLPWPVRDQVAARYCAAFDWEAPQSAFEAAFRISDRQLREQALREAAERMKTRERATTVLERVQLPSPEAAELRRIVEQL